MKRVSFENRRGMTLIEVMVGLVIMGFLVSAVLSFLRQQEMAYGFGTGKMNSLQNHRFAAEILERNLRTTGTGVAAGQPFLVYADSTTIAFNADFATNDTADVFAIYRDPTALNTEVGSLTRARRFILPQTTFAYPDSTFWDGGATSPAETIIFYFAPDGATARTDDFILYRQVNDLAPEVVARNLLRDAQRPFFRYQEVIVSDTTVPAANWIPSQALPLRHTAAVHMAPSDTGSVARIDRIRAVEVSLRATDGRTGELSQEGSMRRLIHMPNAGQMQLRTCGDPPLFNSAVSIGQVAGDTRIEVTWDASVDEGSGEQDVVRYAIFRRIGGVADWGEPFFSIPAGKANYIYSDAAVTVGETYQYAVTAQDCTPSMSGLRVSSQLTVSP